jgi:hypothetical protein
MVRADLTFDRAVIMAIAVSRTRASAPPPRRWRRWLADELRLVWGSALALRDTRRAEVEIAALSVTERAARQCELKAALAESAIPSRPAEAAALREQAAAIRASEKRAAA